MPDFRIETYRILEATNPAEYNALSDANKERYKIIISAGTIDLRTSSIAHTALWNMFDEESVTGMALRNPDNRFVLIQQEEE